MAMSKIQKVTHVVEDVKKGEQLYAIDRKVS